MDVERIGEIAQKHGLLFVVDASQTAGVFPIDVQKMHIDILCLPAIRDFWDRRGPVECT